MPIFENDDEMSPDEFVRQQKELNEKIARLEVEAFLERMDLENNFEAS